MNSSETAESKTDISAKALLRKMQKCSRNHVDLDEEEYRKRQERAQYGRQ